MKNKLFKSILLLSSLLLVFVAGCKKTETTPDDPTITYKSLNKTITVVPGGAMNVDSIDLNGDGLSEILTEFTNVAGDTGVVIFAHLGQSVQIAIDGITPTPYAKIFNKDDTSPTSSTAYYNGAYISIKASGYRLALVNGEGYIVFRFSTGTKYQYGWMKVSINSAYTEFKILEYAYSINPDTPIKVGAQ